MDHASVGAFETLSEKKTKTILLGVWKPFQVSHEFPPQGPIVSPPVIPRRMQVPGLIPQYDASRQEEMDDL